MSQLGIVRGSLLFASLPDNTDRLLDDCLLNRLGVAVGLGDRLQAVFSDLDKVSCSVEGTSDFAFSGRNWSVIISLNFSRGVIPC